MICSRRLLRGVGLRELDAQLLQRMKLPAHNRTAAGPLFLLEQTSPELAELVRQWMHASMAAAEEGRSTEPTLYLAAGEPRGMDVPAYIKRLCGAALPSIIAVDAAPAEVGAALHYGCSLHYGLRFPCGLRICTKNMRTRSLIFSQAIFCASWRSGACRIKCPSCPSDTPQRIVASEFQFLYNQMMAEAQAGLPTSRPHTKALQRSSSLPQRSRSRCSARDSTSWSSARTLFRAPAILQAGCWIWPATLPRQAPAARQFSFSIKCSSVLICRPLRACFFPTPCGGSGNVSAPGAAACGHLFPAGP